MKSPARALPDPVKPGVRQVPRVHFGSGIWQRPAPAVAAVPAATAVPASFATAGWQAAGAQRMQLQQDRSLQTLGGATMGTTWSLRLVNPDYAPLAPVYALVQSTLDEVIAQMSNWEADSRLSRFNAAAPGSWHELPAELAQVIDAALHWAQVCDGAWDPTVGALVALWGYGPRAQPQQAHSGQLPSEAEVAQALRHCGYQRLQWEPAQRRLLQPGGLQLDLSGIAKGFAVDWVAQRLQAAGWQHGLLEIGGEILGWGQRPDGQPWRVAVAGLPPEAQGSATPEAVPLQGGALATSGDHWHVFTQGGRRYSHTIDPRTGQPVAHALTSITVFHAACMHADALATVLTVLGPQAGWDFALAQHVAAVFHTHPDAAHPQGQRRSTPAWDARFASAGGLGQ
ncbi:MULTISPECIES: FAD:protein FMN transferase [Comamonas]|uniref:FAD:protein FMN transferase n=1 Tax=Comamonas TaxID=283 RepID=UPI002103773C|nr:MULTISPECIES: FAD:protein FMN transferase [Comamonas]